MKSFSPPDFIWIGFLRVRFGALPWMTGKTGMQFAGSARSASGVRTLFYFYCQAPTHFAARSLRLQNYLLGNLMSRISPRLLLIEWRIHVLFGIG
jgi:hypothetical protein